MKNYSFTYRILYFINRLTSTIILWLSYRTIYSYLNVSTTIFSNIFYLIVSFILSEMIYWVAKKLYKPHFIDKDDMNLADWIDKSIGPKKDYEMVDKKVFKSRYGFELDFVVLTIAFLLSVFVTVVIVFMGGMNVIPMHAINNIYLANAFYIYVSYAIFLAIIFLYMRRKYLIENPKGEEPRFDVLDRIVFTIVTLALAIFIFVLVDAVLGHS